MLNGDDGSYGVAGPFTETAISQHEMFLSWVAAGFTPEQAMSLLQTIVAEIVRGSTGA